MKEIKNECPVCTEKTKTDNQHDAFCEECGFNITKKQETKDKES